MSQHIGDMENLETVWAFERSFGQMKNLFQISPEIIACDKHPNYLSSNWARKIAENNEKIKLVEVQHHRAHIASVMAENGFEKAKKLSVLPLTERVSATTARSGAAKFLSAIIRILNESRISNIFRWRAAMRRSKSRIAWLWL